MLNDIRYRNAVLADVPQLIGLRRPGEAGGDPRMREYLAGEHSPSEALPPRSIWLAEVGRVPVGYIAGHLTSRFGCDGELQWIYVVPDYRRAAVGSRLLRLLADWFRQRGAHRVCVDVGNETARHFYRGHGAIPLNKHWMQWKDISVILDTKISNPP